jgi:regulatory protein
MRRPPSSIKVRALQWLAQREHSRTELRDKLLRLLNRSSAASDGIAAADGETDADEPNPAVELTPAADQVEALLDWLAAQGYLSQSRFIESRVHARQSRFGNLRIRQELKRHDATLDVEALQALAASEYERARVVWGKKFGQPALDATGRVRQMRFLTGRGFTPEVVRRVMRAAGTAEPSQADQLIDDHP